MNHLLRRSSNTIVRRCTSLLSVIQGLKQGEAKKTSLETIHKDLDILNLTKYDFLHILMTTKDPCSQP